MSNPDESDRLQALQARIDAIKGEADTGSNLPDPHSQAQLAWRMVIELVSGLGIGFGLGYGLDWLLGTSPWLMIVFLFLGLAAGVQTMMRSAAEIQRQREEVEDTVPRVRQGHGEPNGR